jgi:hypothetical protein
MGGGGFLGADAMGGAFFNHGGTEETEVTEGFVARACCPLPEMGFLGMDSFFGVFLTTEGRRRRRA